MRHGRQLYRVDFWWVLVAGLWVVEDYVTLKIWTGTHRTCLSAINDTLVLKGHYVKIDMRDEL
jgi:hypothetical protein